MPQQPYWIAGVDEAGRGPLAGPVIAAAVILDPEQPINGLGDSKKLTHTKREKLYDEIQMKAKAWAIARAEVQEIDSINILQASLLAMQRAVHQLATTPSEVRVDGNKTPDLPMPTQAIIKGDDTEACISAASILAKVARDREMAAWEYFYPGYGLLQHKGYPTKSHMQAISELGVTAIHRRSYAPVQRILQTVG